MDISVKAHQKRTGRDGRSSSGKSSGLTSDRSAAKKPPRVRAREDILDPTFLGSLLPGVQERERSNPADQRLAELRAHAVAGIPQLRTLCLNVLMLAEGGLGTVAITQTLDIFERDVQTSFLRIYDELGMKDVAPNKKRELLFSAWRAFVLKETTS